MRVCSKCKVIKDESDYYVKDSKSGRLHAHCKSCYRLHRTTYYAKHYETYKDEYRYRARERKKRLRDEYRKNIKEYLLQNPCADCGEQDIRVLELDHINANNKTFSISQGVRLGYSWDKIYQEIQKCRVLCSNCHKKRTATQFGWHKNILS